MSRDSKPAKETIETIIFELYKESLKKKDKSRVCYYVLSIGLEEEPWVIKDKLKSLDYLKSRGIIMRYTKLAYQDNDLDKQHKEMIHWGIELVVCKFIPSEIINYLVKLWKPKFETSKELAEKLIFLKECIQSFFKSCTLQTKQLDLEKQYKIVCQRIKRLIFLSSTTIYPYAEFFSKYESPFASLYSAPSELEKKNLSLKDIIKQLEEYYAKAIGLIKLFAIDRQEINLKLDRNSKYPKIISPIVPRGTRWEQIVMKFLNGHEVLIKTGDISIVSDYEALGFADNKSKLKLPKVQWDLLVGLSKVNGELTWKNNDVLQPRVRSSATKQKQLLSDTLKKAFGINNDPFYDYEKEKAYRIKMRLIPEDDDIIEDDEISRYIAESAPLLNK